MAADHELVDQVRQGDRQAFAQIVDRYKARIFHTTLRMLRNHEDAEEAAQDTFVRAYRGLGTFREEATFSTWIFKICFNVCLNYLARKNRTRSRAPEAELSDLPASDTPASLFEAREFEKLVETATGELPPKYRSVVVLYHLQHLSYEEIAGILELPVNTVKTHLFRARGLLRQRILQILPKEEVVSCLS